MRRFINYIGVLVLVALMGSCSSVNKMKKMPMVGDVTGAEYVEKAIALAPQWNNISGKTSIELQLGKKERTRVNASLRIRRGQLIQLSVAPVLGIEVARLDLTPEGLLLVDRVNKRFVRAPFTELSELLHIDVNFHILQSLFLNELFLPGRTSLSASDVSSFQLSMKGDRVKLQPKKMRRVNYQFLTSSRDASLEQTALSLRGTAYSLVWDYSDFTQLEGRLFPKKTIVSLRGVAEPYSLRFKMSRLSVNGNWNGTTRLSSKYKEIALREILKVLLK